MPTYSFFYDEAEHSRKINYKTISASNYYDNFVTMIVGWPDDKNDILQRHTAFEVTQMVSGMIYLKGVYIKKFFDHTRIKL